MKTLNALLLLIVVASLTGCKKNKEPLLTTTAASLITQTTASSGGNVTSDGGETVLSRGVCWSTFNTPTISDNKTLDSAGTGSFVSALTGLTTGTIYYVRAYATNSAGTGYGNEVSFTTVQIAVPVLTTIEITSITQTTAVSGGNITADNGGSVIARGVCWNKSVNPNITNSKTTETGGLGVFTSNLNQLTTNTKYYVKAYATNSAGTGYGNQVSFITNQVAVPVLITTAITSITQTTAISGGNITADNGESVTARGVCWGTITNPTTANSKTTDGTGIGSFVSNLTSLQPGTIYYVRAYATNSVGTSYGNEVSFTTLAELSTITTSTITGITPTTAISGGNITSDGGATITARGVCWSTSQNPTLADSKSIDGTGTGVFTSSIAGLTLGTTYYVRAYATNSAGTAYGNNASFITSSTQIQLPTITTTNASSITATSAISGGTVSSDGGATVTIRGVCWSTTASPTTSDSKTANGTGTGSFTSSITGLTSGRLYYVRAYATNSAGTAYGSQISFITQLISQGTVSDVDGNTYSTVTIGNQEWMTKNLKTTKYNDNTAILLVTDNYAWSNLSSQGYCWYDNSVVTYGALYNWYTVNTGKLCPIGWHVPSDDEWTTLTTYLGGESVAGGKLKESGTAHWISPNTGATNETGFTALPGGFRNYSGEFSSVGYNGNWWSSTSTSTTIAWPRGMSCNFSNVYSPNFSKRSGFSVRCLRD
ncbi:MAG: fibrobacter succinogenes major paralogous domain-containing protein [Bacteroidia bacterium]|nr:fibrobacter succinogenes major paralogous domain-containing protein [Bacteroidia bacterium]